MIKNMKFSKKIIVAAMGWGMVSQLAAQAADTAMVAAASGAGSSSSNSYIPWLLVSTAVALAIVILFMGSLLGKVAIMKLKDNAKSIALVSFLFSAASLMAAGADANSGFRGFSSFELNMILLGVIFMEVLIILYFAYWLKAIVLPKKSETAAEAKVSMLAQWWDKMNNSVAVEKEKDVQLDHDYDGIKELDNALPPWWVYGFYLTIVFAGIYIWRYHISGSAPLQVEELKIDLAKAELQQAEYNKLSANKVDENSIEYKPDASILADGQAVFKKNCVACHGENAQGISGPNLTDEYWKHGGSIKNIFKTIKVGVPSMGMIAWGETLTPKEMASVATYVKSLKGSNPANAKAPEGELYKEEAEGAPASQDSATAPAASGAPANAAPVSAAAVTSAGN
jgi:cytochrome c oxidase cbb3-type subunit III